MKFKTLTNPCLPEVELILTAEEASVLVAIVGKIAGYSNEDSPRTFISELYRRLSDGGYASRPIGASVTWEGKNYKFSHDMRVDKA